MEKQCTSHILMIRPCNFGFNTEAAESNAFMTAETIANPQALAQMHFDAFVEQLRVVGVQVHAIDDLPEPKTPDSIFPNNWVSFHADGRVILYPMEVSNRRNERRMDILDALKTKFKITEIADLSVLENEGIYLEGTGSLVLDRTHKTAYVCRSSRSSEQALSHWQNYFTDYKVVAFNAVDATGFPIYHTNVMMAVAADFVIVCLETIRDKTERSLLLENFETVGHEIIEIDLVQMGAFAGNMLQVENTLGEKILVMSTQAYKSLNVTQIKRIEAHSRILHAELGVIETLGGGSARCMMAEIHLEQRAAQ